MTICDKCNKDGYYFSIYDTHACLECDVWLENDHCLDTPEPCKYFRHITGIKPSEAERSAHDNWRVPTNV